MRTLIFGGKGQLGRELGRQFATEGEVLGVDLPEVDIADNAVVAAAVERFAPDLVINAAAYTDVDGAEEDAHAAFLANETGAANVARAASGRGVSAVYYSTDYVFGGTKSEPYLPEDPVHPIGVYARSKAAGEAATRAANPRHFIVRTAWLYGVGGNNFVEKILRAAASRPSLKVVDDEIGSPTYAQDLAEATRALCRTDGYGTYHVVNAGACSRFAFAKEIVRRAGMDVPIAPCSSTEFETKAERPLYSVLSTEAFEARTGHVLRPWEDALEDYMKRR